MGEDFGRENQSGFERARDRLVAAFVKAEGPAFARVIEQLLDHKHGYLDGDLETWSAADVETVLYWVYPQKVMIDDEQIAEVPPAFAAFLRFLGRRQPARVASLMKLAAVVEASASRFVAAMHDEDNWSFGKRMWSTAHAEGVDVTDQDQLDRWVQDFNERSLAERDQILGPMPKRPSAAGARVGRLPPVVLATDDELHRLASHAVLVRRLIALVEFVGTGRAATDLGNLKLADGKQLIELLGTDDVFDGAIGDRVFKTKSVEELPGVDYAYRVALAADLLTIDGRKVKPGGNVAWVPGSALDIAYGAFLVMLHLVSPTTYRLGENNYGFGWYAEELDGQLPTMLLALYREQGPVVIDELVVEAWHELEATFDLTDVDDERRDHYRHSVDYSMRVAFDRLADLGILEIIDEVRTPNEYVGEDRSGGSVALAPLGVWAMQRTVARVADAPVVGALRTHAAAELLVAASDLAETVARAEVDAWIAHHGLSAAQELCDALPTVGETARGLAFAALLRIGPPAADAVRTLAGTVDLADFVTVFRVDTLLATPGEMDRSSDPASWVRLLHTVVELWGPVAAAAVWAAPAAGAPGLDAMLERAWRVRGEPTETVLAAIGEHHADKRVAKAARKALFKHRSAR